MHFASHGFHPEPADPVEKEGAGQPHDPGIGVLAGNVRGIYEQRKNENGDVAARYSHRQENRIVGHAVIAPARRCAFPFGEALEFRTALDQRQAQEETWKRPAASSIPARRWPMPRR